MMQTSHRVERVSTTISSLTTQHVFGTIPQSLASENPLVQGLQCPLMKKFSSKIQKTQTTIKKNKGKAKITTWDAMYSRHPWEALYFRNTKFQTSKYNGYFLIHLFVHSGPFDDETTYTTSMRQIPFIWDASRLGMINVHDIFFHNLQTLYVV